jgi:hypothetical protein
MKQSALKEKQQFSEKDMAESFLACWKANVPDGAECKLSFKDWFEQFSKLKNDIKENIFYDADYYSKHSNDNMFKSPNIEKKWFQKLE